MRRILAFAAGLAVAAAISCGGGGDAYKDWVDDGSEGVSKQLGLKYPLGRTASELADKYGDRGGARALLLAADRGYTLKQIGAALPPEVGADGTIKAADGSVVQPAGKASKRFSAAGGLGGSLRASAAAPEDVVLDFFARAPTPAPDPKSRWLSRDGSKTTAAILGLLAAGYSVDQIVENAVLGNSFVPDYSGMYFADENGAICPQNGPPGLCEAVDRRIEQIRNQHAGITTPTIVVPPAVGATSAPAAAASATPASDRVCAEGTFALPASVAGVQTEKTAFQVCLPRRSGEVTGTAELVFSGTDADCTGRFSSVVTLTGRVGAAGAMDGAASVTSTVMLTGACVQERVIFNKPTQTDPLPAWTGTFDGTTVTIKVAIDPDEPNLLLTLSGRVR